MVFKTFREPMRASTLNCCCLPLLTALKDVPREPRYAEPLLGGWRVWVEGGKGC